MYFNPLQAPLSLSLAIVKLLSDHQATVTKPRFSLRSPSHYHQAFAECRFTLTHIQICLPIHSSHKSNTLDAHLTFHSITFTHHQDSLFSSNHQAAVTKPLLIADSPSPISKSVLLIHSSHKPNTIDTHLTFHSITLSSNRDSQGFVGLD